MLEYLERMKTRFWTVVWPLVKRYWFDALLVAGMGGALAVAVVDLHKGGGDPGPRGPLWFDVLVTVAMFLPLFWRMRYPFAAPAATAVIAGAGSFVDGRLLPHDFFAFLLLLAVAFLFGALPEWRQAVAGLAILYGVGLIGVHNDPIGKAGDLVWLGITFSIAWACGFGLGSKLREADEAKERAARAEGAREEQARLAVAEERARVARELHDIVGHSVSVMTVQAAGARRLLDPDQEREREALMLVEQTGREALAEMRRLVGVLRRPEEAPALAPQPSLEHLDKLVEQAREAGLPVGLNVEGEPVALSAGLDLTAYRFVQEGLTNALKHANAHRADVLVRYDNGHVELTVSDDGTGDGGGESGGHGLVGMRERISVYGGELEAGRRPEGGYRLHARLPVA
ncbi:MAG: sensor histidine kinase [Candidatus Rokuibacteriota bacterium]|nr:MAG: sensor histidine kinase [Candidatus Rokubacteria bacterium]